MSACIKNEINRLFEVEDLTVWVRRDLPKPPAQTYWTRQPDYIRVTGHTADAFWYSDMETPGHVYAPIGIVDLFAAYRRCDD